MLRGIRGLTGKITTIFPTRAPIAIHNLPAIPGYATPSTFNTYEQSLYPTYEPSALAGSSSDFASSLTQIDVKAARGGDGECETFQ